MEDGESDFTVKLETKEILMFFDTRMNLQSTRTHIEGPSFLEGRYSSNSHTNGSTRLLDYPTE